MKKMYNGKMIEVEDKETQYFISTSRATEKEAIEVGKAELNKHPLINRYEIIKHLFKPTEAYPKGERFSIHWYYNRPLNSYFNYGTDEKAARRVLNEFKQDKDKPLYLYPVSSVERNMEEAALCGAFDTLNLLQRDRDKYLRIFEIRNKMTPYTNWSGD